jgi:hypothetical protein
MTHSLHRQGDGNSLHNDYVLLCTPANGINSDGAAEKLRRALDILLEIGPANIGFYGHGSLMNDISLEEARRSLHDTSRLRCCFDSKEKLKSALQRIKAEDFGLSITISGLVSEVQDLCEELSLKPHTINIPCGIWGKTDRLPQPEVLELSTMCGHGMIGHNLVKQTIDDLRDGTVSVREAVRRLGEPCSCGIFNPTRAREILKKYIPTEETEENEFVQTQHICQCRGKTRSRHANHAMSQKTAHDE